MTATSATFRGGPYVPRGNFEPMTTYGLIVDDLTAAWDSMALAQPIPDARANFLFGNAVMVLFEFLCRTAAADSHGQAMRRFEEELANEDRKYFLELPAAVRLPRFTLPASAAVPPERQLLALLFDTVRNGQAHQGQQIPVYLRGGDLFIVALDGVRPGKRLRDAWAGPVRPDDHLKLAVMDSGNLRLVFRPDIFFLDITRAAGRAQVLQLADSPSFFHRAMDATSPDLQRALRSLS